MLNMFDLWSTINKIQIDSFDLFLIHFVIYWTISIGFYKLDWYLYNSGTVMTYKQNPINQHYWKYCHDSFSAALTNQMLLSLPLSIYMKSHVNNFEFNFSLEIIKVIFYAFLVDFWFYVFHNAFHKFRILYQIHKFHHRVYSTTAVSALDASLIEHLFLNLGSIAIGPILWTGHIFTIRFWISIATITTCVSHSGYKHWCSWC